MRNFDTLYHRARRIRFETLESRCMLSAAGDYDGNGVVNTNDHSTWKAAFGNTVAHGSGADRFFEHGRDGFSDPSLGTLPYYSGTAFASENRVNFYNENDYALDICDTNNFFKPDYIQSTVWPYDYEFTPGDGENVNNDIFLRSPDTGPDVELDLALPNGLPGRDAYEIMAFFAVSASLALGTKPVAAFDNNIDIETFGMLGGSDIRANHSYQFNHDAAETWNFYDSLKTETAFGSTHSFSAAEAFAPVASPASSQESTINGNVILALNPGEPRLKTGREAIFERIGQSTTATRLELRLAHHSSGLRRELERLDVNTRDDDDETATNDEVAIEDLWTISLGEVLGSQWT